MRTPANSDDLQRVIDSVKSIVQYLGGDDADDLADTYQPLDSDLTAIAALTTSSFGRSVLELANAAAGRTLWGLGSAATEETGTSGDVVVKADGANTFSSLQGYTAGFTVGSAADTSPDVSNVAGAAVNATGIGRFSADGANALSINRKTSDGVIVAIRQDGTTEGSISVSGTTVSYNSFCGSHWSQLTDRSNPDIPRGTVVEAIDEMCVWQDPETGDHLPNDQLVKFKVSDTPASPRVYGVFKNWDEDGDAEIASLGAFLIRIDPDETVQGGDLLESAGDGCARVQSDTVMRSTTIAKVNSAAVIERFEDGSYLVPCSLHCG